MLSISNLGTFIPHIIVYIGIIFIHTLEGEEPGVSSIHFQGVLYR